MINFEKPMFFGYLNDTELFEEVKKLFVSEFAGLPISEVKKDALYNECSQRDTGIYDEAIISAIQTTEKYYNQSHFDGNSKLIPFEKIEISDIKRLINPILEEISGEKKAITSIEQDNEMIKELSDKFLIIRVEGDSMIGAGINDGDLVMADKNLNPNNDDIVVVSLYDKIFIKIFKSINGSVVLESANEKYSAINITPEMNFRLEGIVRMKLQNL